MEIEIKLKNSKTPLIYKGDRIDILDFEMNGVKYKQIRCFKKGFSKSELVLNELILNIKEIRK
ncbi:hypothetical protein H8S10_14840 [Clostridium sp. NSJ-49]|uniref:Uncharacterized protein n=1 Tax=Clostridium disporicum TaxID=84024 RepID=A0A173Y7B8_9CLOT|nr:MULTISPECIES: hypothetical protein [Clostridium]MBC5626723.1 hypothetical protein [Clostridium sp. NSJ-49]MCD2500978.1 hypothetical protein [Clostridium sp. NSJ-145]MDU6339713.1 hypothetical protein [Clostridium sp.]CUN59117.1 Uncharacterised protein [Clostridium disporicum]